MDTREQIWDALYNHQNLSSKQLLDKIMELSEVKQAISLLEASRHIKEVLGKEPLTCHDFAEANELLRLKKQGKLVKLADDQKFHSDIEDDFAAADLIDKTSLLERINEEGFKRVETL
jgi:hypothetical protein